MAWEHDIKRKYNLTVEEYDKILEGQGGRCFICRAKPKKRLCIDHDHNTQAIRVLLCTTCNFRFGKMERRKNSQEFFANLVKYIQEFGLDGGKESDGY